jgi:hypothetical protein
LWQPNLDSFAQKNVKSFEILILFRTGLHTLGCLDCGVNILFLALGFLRWYEDDKSDVPREAPLILLPVSLVRDAKRAAFDVKLREDDIAANQALQERLRGDFGLALPSVPEGDDWLPSDYFDAIIKAISPKRRWSIDANAIELGFYSFSKLLRCGILNPAIGPIIHWSRIRSCAASYARASPPSRRSCPRPQGSTKY